MKIHLAVLTLATAALATAATEADFGLIAVSSFETARLAAFCDGSVTPAPCDITFEFHDVNGRTLKQANLILQPNTGGFVDFTPPPAAVGIPLEIDPCWTIQRGAAFASLQVFDVFSLRTRIMINWADGSVRPAGELDFGMAGITRSDTARLGAVCEGDGSVLPPPCDVSFEFHDAAGRTVKQTRLVLQPDTAGFVNLKWEETGSTARKVDIIPCIKVGSGNPVGSFAIIDNFTGLTLSQAYPAAELVAPVIR